MHRWLLSLAVLVLAAGSLAYGQRAYAGDWNLVVDNTTGRIPGLGPSAQLIIEVLDDVVTIRKFDGDAESYRPGVATPLDGGRTGTLTVSDGALTLTTTQWSSGDVMSVVTDEYALVGNDLIVTRTLRVERGGVPADTPQNRWEARYIRQ
ncbi:MAG TPA: hypothetical protein VH417_09235 [Vicinamibacterales bacterium]|jgi:hypothetical protein